MVWRSVDGVRRVNEGTGGGNRSLTAGEQFVHLSTPTSQSAISSADFLQTPQGLQPCIHSPAEKEAHAPSTHRPIHSPADAVLVDISTVVRWQHAHRVIGPIAVVGLWSRAVAELKSVDASVEFKKCCHHPNGHPWHWSPKLTGQGSWPMRKTISNCL